MLKISYQTTLKLKVCQIDNCIAICKKIAVIYVHYVFILLCFKIPKWYNKRKNTDEAY